jgi:hypothetical protein
MAKRGHRKRKNRPRSRPNKENKMKTIYSVTYPRKAYNEGCFCPISSALGHNDKSFFFDTYEQALDYCESEYCGNVTLTINKIVFSSKQTEIVTTRNKD